MNTQKREKILQVFIKEVIKKSIGQSVPEGYFDPVKMICQILMEEKKTAEEMALKTDSLQTDRNDGSRGIIDFAKSLLKIEKKDTWHGKSWQDQGSFQSRILSFLPHSLNQTALQLLDKPSGELDPVLMKHKIHRQIYKTLTFHRLLDNIQLWLEEIELKNKSFASFFTLKKTDLQENTFYSWIIRQEFITKIDYSNLDLSSIENIKRFVTDDKLLGSVCFCDLSTSQVKNHVYSIMKRKYKTQKIPDIFLELFSSQKETQKFFGRIVIIFGFYIVLFSFDQFMQYLTKNCAANMNHDETENWSSKDFAYYILESFQEGINLKYPFSHFKARSLQLEEVLNKVAVIFWHKEVRQETIRRERSPVDETSKHNMKGRCEPVLLEDIKNRRMLSILRGIVESRVPLALQPGKGETAYFSVTCIPARLLEDRLLLAMRKKEGAFIKKNDTLNFKCRFAFIGGKDKLRYYSFESQLMGTRNLGQNIIGLEAVLPRNYQVSERQAERYVPLPGEIEGVALWICNGQDIAALTSEQPFAVYPSAGEELKVLNVSSGGMRLSLDTNLLRSRSSACHVNQQYIIRFVLWQDPQVKYVSGYLNSQEHSQANNEVYLRSIVRNACQDEKENGQTIAGLQFIQEAIPAAGGKLTWSDIQFTGSWHIGNWIFSRIIQQK